MGVSGLRSVACTDSIGGGSYAESTSTSGTIPAADNINGVNNWTCVVTDNAGSTTNPSITEQLDTITPTVSVPASSTSYSSSPAALPISATVGPSGFSDPICTNSLNGDTYTFGTSGSIPASDESNGINAWSCVATSNADLSSGPQTFTYELDSSSPTMDQPVVTSAWLTSAMAIPVSASDPVGITSINCSDSLGNDTYATTAASGSIPASDESIGTNVWTCSATNDSNQTSNVVSVTEKLDPETPTVLITTSANSDYSYSAVYKIPTISVNGSAGPSGGTITCSGDGITPQNFSLSGGTVDLTGLSNGGGEIDCVTTAGNGLTASDNLRLQLNTNQQGDVPGTANIQGTVLALTTPNAVTFSGEITGVDQSINDSVPADQTFTAEDATGSFNGWNITAYLNGQFADGGGATLPSTALSLDSSSASSSSSTGPADVCITNSTCTISADPNVSYPITIPTSTSSGATVYDAGINSGMGTMNVTPLDWWLNVPGNALAGVYTTQVVMSINSGPSS